MANPWVIAGVSIASAGLIGSVIRVAVNYGEWRGTVNTEITSIKEYAKESREDITKILDRLTSRTIVQGSLITLSELGEEISETLDAEQWAFSQVEYVDNVDNWLIEKDQLEIQRIAFEYADNVEPSELFTKRVKAIADENGLVLTEVEMKDVLGVELRDILLNNKGVQIITTGPEPNQSNIDG